MSGRPNVLVVLTDQLRYPPVYESDELAQFRREAMPAQETLRRTGISFKRYYPITAACAPSRASLLTDRAGDLEGAATRRVARRDA